MTLAVGDKAPTFDKPTSGDGSMSLESLAGSPVVLYFYPRDDTPGCTKQACGFRDAMPDFSSVEANIIGVSRDTASSHDKFIAKFDLNFPLVVDDDGSITEAYGVWVEKNMYGKKSMGIERATYLIDKEGTIARIWRKVKVPGHIEEVLEAVRNL